MIVTHTTFPQNYGVKKTEIFHIYAPMISVSPGLVSYAFQIQNGERSLSKYVSDSCFGATGLEGNVLDY